MHMDTALIVVGVLLIGTLVVWVFTFLSDPKEIDETEEAQVREEAPAAREETQAQAAAQTAQSNADDIAFYSPGESSGNE